MNDKNLINDGLSLKEERYVMRKQAEEFLTMMGYEPTPKLIRRFAAYLKHFDQCYPLETFYS